MINKKRLLAAAISVCVTAPAYATNGYFSHGVGQRSSGMGGVGVALPQDALAGGINPAGMALVGNRIDLGAYLFSPQRRAKISGNSAFPPGTPGAPQGKPSFDGSFDANDTDLYGIPEFGYNHMLNDRWAIGVSVFGNGGMAVDYKEPVFAFSGSRKPALDLEQLFVTPTLAWKLNDRHSFGIGLNLVLQGLKVEGVDNFANPFFSSSPNNVSRNDRDWAYGAGVRIGWVGKVSDTVTLGATYQSRTYMQEWDKYKGLLAEQGDFDIPSNWALGMAVTPTPKWTVAFDLMRINYGEVASIGNPLSKMSGLFGVPGGGTNLLGSDGGAGFGWNDIWVFKLGLAYQYNDRLTVRGGWNHNEQPIPKSQTFFNILAPGVVTDHLTLGGTWKFDSGNELTFAYMHAFKEKVKGSNSIPAAFGGGEADIQMYQNALGLAYTWHL